MNVYNVEVKTKTENRETLDRFSVTGETPDEALLSAFAEPKPNIVGTCEFISTTSRMGFILPSNIMTSISMQPSIWQVKP